MTEQNKYISGKGSYFDRDYFWSAISVLRKFRNLSRLKMLLDKAFNSVSLTDMQANIQYVQMHLC